MPIALRSEQALPSGSGIPEYIPAFLIESARYLSFLELFDSSEISFANYLQLPLMTPEFLQSFRAMQCKTDPLIDLHRYRMLEDSPGDRSSSKESRRL